MKQGTASPVVVRVSTKPEIATIGIPGWVSVERAKISRFTVACLISRPGEFRLMGTRGEPTDSALCQDDGCSCLRQTLVGDEADLEWSVTPLASGEMKLRLRVAARLLLSNSKEESHDVLSKEGVVQVDSDVWYVASVLIGTSWKELLASVGGVGAILAFGRKVFAKRSPPSRRAGFGRDQPAQSNSWVSRILKSIRP